MPCLSRRAVLACSLAVLASPSFAAESRHLSVEEAYEKAKVGEIILIDVREPDEWADTGIPEGALPIAMRDPELGAKLDAAVNGDRSARVALICRSGIRSRAVATAMREAGFTNVFDVGEGMIGSWRGPGWIRSGLPVEHPQ